MSVVRRIHWFPTLFLVGFFLFLSGTSYASQKGNAPINKHGFNSSADCGHCHGDIFKSWRGSMHSHATSDPIFIASYMEAHYKDQEKATKLCLSCHAPTTTVTHGRKLDVSLTSEGITCDFCHSISSLTGEVDAPFNLDLGVTKYGPNKKGRVKQHKIAYSKLHRSSELCATCHEYRPGGVPVMTTYSEWKDSVYAEEGKQCQYCHMPETKGHIANNVTSERGEVIYSHDLAGSHSVEQLRKAMALKIERVGRAEDRLTVTVSLTNIGSGHRMPTGIPTRKLMLYCEVRAPGGKVYKKKIAFEKVIFDADGNELTSDADIMLGRGATIAFDNRIAPKETRRETFTFYIPATKQADVSVWLDYLYTPVIRAETEMRIEMNRDHTLSLGHGE